MLVVVVIKVLNIFCRYWARIRSKMNFGTVNNHPQTRRVFSIQRAGDISLLAQNGIDSSLSVALHCMWGMTWLYLCSYMVTAE
jgi:hypothetical protein